MRFKVFLAFLTLISISPITSLAESLELFGVPLPVDKFERIVSDPLSHASDTAKVGISQREEIVAFDEAGSWALNVIAENPVRARRISIEDYRKIIFEAIRSNQPKIVISALLGAANHIEGSRSEVLDLFSEIYHSPSGLSYFRQLLDPQVVDPKRRENLLPTVTSYAFIVIGLSDSVWARGIFNTFPFTTQNEIRSLLRDNTLKDLKGRNWLDAEKGIALEEAIFRSDDPTFKRIKVLSTRISEALKLSQGGDFEGVLSLGDLAKGDEMLAPIVSPLVLDTIHREVDRLIGLGLYQKALSLLTRTDVKFRTETTHDLLLRLFTNYKSTLTASIEPHSHIYISNISSQDPQISSAYKDLLTARFYEFRKAGDLDSAEATLVSLSELTIDNPQIVDNLRVVLARDYVARGQRVFARRVISTNTTSISLYDRFIFFVSGMYGDHILWLMLGLIPIILAWFYLARARRIEQTNTSLDDIIFGWHAPKSKLEPIHDMRAGKSILSPAMQEYNRCLSELGLKPGASLKAIKGRYRELIKRVHPDLNKNIDDHGRERFVHLTQIYDKTIDLRRELKIQL